MPTSSAAAWDRQHLLGLEGLSRTDLTMLLDRAQRYLPIVTGQSPALNELAGLTIANLFFEDSTRTRSSFVLAARRLGAETLELTSTGSSVNKGESLVDTACNLQAMGVHAFVVRTSASGGPAMIAKAVRVPVINAGDGRHEHPTQGLLDLLTLQQRLGDVQGKTIAIVGDIVSSRVARSNIHALTTMGAHVVLCGPVTLVPKALERIASGPGTVSVVHDLDAVVDGAAGAVDAIMMLRVQFERAGGGPPLIAGDYRQLYGLSVERAKRLPDHAIVLHPGPINRGLELDSAVADDPKRSVILQQVTNGVAVRMAVLATTCRQQ